MKILIIVLSGIFALIAILNIVSVMNKKPNKNSLSAICGWLCAIIYCGLNLLNFFNIK